MSIKMLIKSLVILSAIYGVAVNAEIQPYAGGQYSYIEYDDLLASEHATFNSLFVRAGAQINEAISAELRLGIGTDDSRVAVDADLQLKTAIGIYVRGGVQATDRIYPYIIAGWTRVKFERSIFGDGSTTASDADVSTGIGVDFSVTEKVKLNLEYMYYFDNSETEIEALSLGIIKSF